MKWKQVMLIVAISAVSAVSSVAIYSKLNPARTSFVQTVDGKAPANYAGFFDKVSGNADPIDFTKAASAAVPAVVHIKTKIPAKKISNQLPRGSRGNSLEDMFGDIFKHIRPG